MIFSPPPVHSNLYPISRRSASCTNSEHSERSAPPKPPGSSNPGPHRFSVLAPAPPSPNLPLMQITRLWLMFPSRLITRPVLWELTKKFEVITNIRQASVTEEIGLVSLELEGERDEIKKTIAWLEELGIKVEPVEINTIEG